MLKASPGPGAAGAQPESRVPTRRRRAATDRRTHIGYRDRARRSGSSVVAYATSTYKLHHTTGSYTTYSAAYHGSLPELQPVILNSRCPSPRKGHSYGCRVHEKGQPLAAAYASSYEPPANAKLVHPATP